MPYLDLAASLILNGSKPMPKRKREDGDERATDFVESLDRGLRLLQAFGHTSGPMTLSDIARAADLPRATARRILFTLAHRGFVSTDGKPSYDLVSEGLFSRSVAFFTDGDQAVWIKPGIC